VGVIAQIQGHKPSATAEKHYTVRPLDLLRLHHERFEAWILEQAGLCLMPRPRPVRCAWCKPRKTVSPQLGRAAILPKSQFPAGLLVAPI
jgi:hypothetical protein